MKCDVDVCENEATVYLTQIVDGKTTQVNLCDKCSKEKGVTDPMGFQLADFLIGAAVPGKAAAETAEDDTLACGGCGFTRAHLKKIGRLGCPECYHTFATDLDNMLRAMHKGTRHIGKAPGKFPVAPAPVAVIPATPVVSPASPKVSVRKRLAELKEAIERAVAEERYEDAARLRDEMREVEAKKRAG